MTLVNKQNRLHLSWTCSCTVIKLPDKSDALEMRDAFLWEILVIVERTLIANPFPSAPCSEVHCSCRSSLCQSVLNLSTNCSESDFCFSVPQLNIIPLSCVARSGKSFPLLWSWHCSSTQFSNTPSLWSNLQLPFLSLQSTSFLNLSSYDLSSFFFH